MISVYSICLFCYKSDFGCLYTCNFLGVDYITQCPVYENCPEFFSFLNLGKSWVDMLPDMSDQS